MRASSLITVAALVAFAAVAIAQPAPIVSAERAAPANPAEFRVFQADHARVTPTARLALQQAVAWQWPHLAPGGDPARVEDYGGDYPVQVLATASLARTPAFKALCAGTSSPGTPAIDEAAIRANERAKTLAEVRALITAVR